MNAFFLKSNKENLHNENIKKLGGLLRQMSVKLKESNESLEVILEDRQPSSSFLSELIFYFIYTIIFIYMNYK